MQSSLFIKYGGFSSIHDLIDKFYEKLVVSELVGFYFENSDMEALITHQTNFISFLMGGPTSYTDLHLQSVHQDLNISEDTWNEVISLLSLTLIEFGMEEDDVKMLINTLSEKKELFICSQ